MNDWEILTDPEQWIFGVVLIFVTLVIDRLVRSWIPKVLGHWSKKWADKNDRKNRARRALIEGLAGSPASLRLEWLLTGASGFVAASSAFAMLMVWVILADVVGLSPTQTRLSPTILLFLFYGNLAVLLSVSRWIWGRLKLLREVYALLLEREMAMKQTPSGEKEGESGEA